MANGRTKAPEKQSCSTFIYNKREGTVLGKTGKAWCKFFVLCFFKFKKNTSIVSINR